MEPPAETELRTAALQWLLCPDPTEKHTGVIALGQSFSQGALTLNPQQNIKEPLTGIPGRPTKPTLVPPNQLSKRSMRTKEGRATLIHALAHIEFNAINLALDAIWRFPNMPTAYYSDWLTIAAEEAYHFSLLNHHLQSLGYAYGDFSGHDALWQMVEDTKDDVLDRMALVPRTLEARGLDATPGIRNKLAQAGDQAAAEILDIILRDEIGHVAIGNHWYHHLCQQRKLDPLQTFETLCQQYKAPKMRPPFNLEARKQAGFTEQELAYLNGEFV